MRAIGFLLLGVGLSWLLYALTLDTSVELPFGGRVQNLSLMEARRTHLMLSGGAIVIGVLLLGFGRMQRASNDDDLDNDADYRDCPFCAEPVRVEAVICRHCRSDLRAVAVYESGLNMEVEAMAAVDVQPDESLPYRILRDAAEAAERNGKPKGTKR